MPLKLIAGLGNPGAEHSSTRHNAGFWFVDTLAGNRSLTFSYNKKFSAELCRYRHGTTDCWICKPQTFMNESGTTIQALLNFYKISIDRVLVVHDEIDLDVGTIRFKSGGGHGGNNGVRDIIQKTGEKNFHRLRIGVGHPGNPDKVVSYVLSKPDTADRDSIIKAISAVLEEDRLLFAGEMQALMNNFNQKQKVL